ncbi:MAG TPA: phosphatase PAP2 family protein [Chitinophagaceae bacterium]|nr:phosphatase PAP2 family protein [Chitinophagaceae bacterium]
MIVLLLLLALVIFILAAREIFVLKNFVFDEDVFAALRPYITPARTRFMNSITFFGKHDALIPLNILLIGYFIYKKKRWFAIRITALALSSLLLKFILKFYFQRARPDIPVIEKVDGYSFPSGHALIGVVFYGLVIFVIWHEVKQKWLKIILTIFFVLFILLISFSRIYLRVHYASDVIAGISVGFIWLVLSLNIIQRIEKRYITRRTLKAEGLEK